MRNFIIILIALTFAGCQKQNYESIIEGNWEGSVAEHYESDHNKYIRLAMFDGEVSLYKTEKVKDESWQDGFGTYTIDGNIITFNIKIGATPKSAGVKNITHAEIVKNEYDEKIMLKVYWTHEGAEDSDGWIWFSKID